MMSCSKKLTYPNYDLTPLHIDLKGITIRVLDGVLYLNRNTSNQLPADIVEGQVLGIPVKQDLHFLEAFGPLPGEPHC